MKSASDKHLVNLINSQLGKETINRYSPHVPYGQIMDFLATQGLKPVNEEDTPFMLLGHSGRVTIDLEHPDYPKRDYFLHLSWYRMGSGNFETVARFESLGKKS
jgi:hypothetical protein